MEIRPLRAREREAFLALLDGWDVGDGWPGGRAFFRRYVEDDPTYRDEHVFVAEEGGQLVSCVQVFPRPLRVRGAALPTAGIGSVWTRPEARGRGVAQRVLAAACRAAAARGLALGLLFAGPVPWYARQGWLHHPLERHLLAAGARPRGAVRLRRADPVRDAEALRGLHARTAERLEGIVLRDDALWRASQRNAGNPHEDVLLAEDAGGAALAYGRATRLAGVRLVTEWGLAADPGGAAGAGAAPAGRGEDASAAARPAAAAVGEAAAEALADVLAALLAEGGVAPNLAFGPGLVGRLEARGAKVAPLRWRGTMLRVLDAPAVAARLGVPPPGREQDANRWLSTHLPPERFAFWPADRF